MRNNNKNRFYIVEHLKRQLLEHSGYTTAAPPKNKNRDLACVCVRAASVAAMAAASAKLKRDVDADFFLQPRHIHPPRHTRKTTHART